ncbi:MAG: DUF5317 domain-containing protein [Nitriliruptorales bacterium]|nr:DUF5317 domain-containing protein [Nitriliruptorales bacterium]
MPLALVTLGAAVIVGYLRGGRLSRIAEADLRSNWLLFAGFGCQVLLDLLAGRGIVGEGVAGYGLILASHLGVLAWVGLNWWRPGMGLVFTGFAMNAVVIAANGAMPVDPDAITALGIGEVAVPAGKHVLMTGDTRLAWLGDTIPLPILRTIVSWGDIVLAAGLIPLLHHLMTFRPAAERRGGARNPDRSETETQTEEMDPTSASPNRP